MWGTNTKKIWSLLYAQSLSIQKNFHISFHKFMINIPSLSVDERGHSTDFQAKTRLSSLTCTPNEWTNHFIIIYSIQHHDEPILKTVLSSSNLELLMIVSKSLSNMLGTSSFDHAVPKIDDFKVLHVLQLWCYGSCPTWSESAEGWIQLPYCTVIPD